MAKKPEAQRQLTAKQALFVVHYLHTLNVIQAELDAGYRPGNAAKYAHELMQLPHVQAAVEAVMGERKSARIGFCAV